MDGAGDGAQETQTLLQIPDTGTGEGVPLQRVRVETKAVGIGAQFKSNRATGENLVPESADEEQEELAAATGSAAE